MNYKEQHLQALAQLSRIFPRDSQLEHLLKTYVIQPRFFPKFFMESTLQGYQQKLENLDPLELIFPLPEQRLEQGELYVGKVYPQSLNFFLYFDDLTKNVIVS